MGYNLANLVYTKVKDTDGVAQAVLAFLAFRADDKTQACYPDRSTIVSCTHYGLTTVREALNRLRDQGYLEWVSGGRKKGRSGSMASNRYKFNFERCADKPVASDVAASTAQTDAKPDPAKKSQSGVVEFPVPQSQDDLSFWGCKAHPIVNDRKQKVSVIPARDESFAQIERTASLQLGREWREKSAVATRTVRVEEVGVVERAMRVCKVNDIDNMRVFSSIMLYKDAEDCLEVIQTFESEYRQGEIRTVKKSLASLLVHRLKQLPDVVKRPTT